MTLAVIVDAAAITINLVIIVVTANAAVMLAAANKIQINRTRRKVEYEKQCENTAQPRQAELPRRQAEPRQQTEQGRQQHLLKNLQQAKKNHHQIQNFCRGTLRFKEILCSGVEATPLPLIASALRC